MNNIRLFPPDATNFKTNGLGSLYKDAIDPVVTEELNGSFEFSMKYPISGLHYDEIGYRSIIVTKSNPYSTPQAFRVYSISVPIDGTIEINAQHISYDLTGIVVPPPPLPQVETPDVPGSFPSITAMFDYINSNALPSMGAFSVRTEMTDNNEFVMPDAKSVRALLGGDDSVLSFYGGEFEFDNFQVIHRESRGKSRGVTIRYGKNLTDLTQSQDGSEKYTGVYPYYYNDQDGQMLGDIQYVEDREYDHVAVLDCSSINWDEEGYPGWEGMPTKAMLNEYAQKYIQENDIASPTVNLDISFAVLSKMDGYEETMSSLEQVMLGDVVRVVFPDTNISTYAECISTEYDAKKDIYTSIQLGDKFDTFSDAVGNSLGGVSTFEQSINKEVAKKVDTTGVIDAINKSVETGKIAANRVDMDGVTVGHAIQANYAGYLKNSSDAIFDFSYTDNQLHVIINGTDHIISLES